MKVLHIPTGGLLQDGICSCIAAYFLELDCTDLELALLATNSPTDTTMSRMRMLPCKIVEIGGRKENPIKYTRDLYRYLKDERFDIVHVHGSSAIMSIELVVAKLVGCRVRIAHSHNTNCDNKKLDKLLRPLFKRLYTHAVACGMDAGQWLFGNKPFMVIRNARNLEAYRFKQEERVRWRSRWGIDETTLLLGHVGHFTYQKNQEYLVQLFKNLVQSRPNSQLVLIGDGQNRQQIEEQTNRLGLKDKVRFLGNVNNIHELLSAMDVMVLPSRYEGLPIVMIEWQASGLPCLISDIVTDECCIADFVYRKSIDEDPKSWAEFLRLYKQVDREKSAAEGCEQLREAGYDIMLEAKRLKKYYESALDEVK